MWRATKSDTPHTHGLPWQGRPRHNGRPREAVQEKRRSHQGRPASCETHLLPSTAEQQATVGNQCELQVPHGHHKMLRPPDNPPQGMQSQLSTPAQGDNPDRQGLRNHTRITSGLPTALESPSRVCQTHWQPVSPSLRKNTSRSRHPDAPKVPATTPCHPPGRAHYTRQRHPQRMQE